MNTVYFIIITILGGLFALFFASGWSSYKYKKIPETPILFRSFIAGIITSGLAAYTWIFGYGGNVSELMEAMGGALDVGNLISGNDSSDTSVSRGRADTESITIGLAPF